MENNTVRKTVTIRQDQAEFLDAHDELNHSAISRQALDAFMEFYGQIDGGLEITDCANGDVDILINGDLEDIELKDEKPAAETLILNTQQTTNEL
jgi:hypothetical protein